VAGTTPVLHRILIYCESEMTKKAADEGECFDAEEITERTQTASENAGLF
jgi:hypothetical protein